MSVLKVPRCIKCSLQRAISNTQLRNRTFTTFLPNLNKEEKKVVQDATKFLSGILGSCHTGSIFAGTGLYHDLKDLDRMLMLNFCENFLADPEVSLFDTTPLLDCRVKHTDIDSLLEGVKMCSPLPVYKGEIDFVNSSSWRYGFTLSPFSIFSGDERLCFIEGDSVYTSVDGHSEVISIKDIIYVGLWVSDDPYNERKLLLGLTEKRIKKLISVTKNDVTCDLGKLTVDTEWMMKTAALLCVNLTRKGNESVHLKVSPALQPENNKWVALRQKIWREMIQKYTWEKDF